MKHSTVNTLQNIGFALFMGAWAGLLCWFFLDAMSMPDVWFSYSTDECVKVINYVEGENFSCENMPSKFNHVWVK
jgi:hypothetical protein